MPEYLVSSRSKGRVYKSSCIFVANVSITEPSLRGCGSIIGRIELLSPWGRPGSFCSSNVGERRREARQVGQLDQMARGYDLLFWPRYHVVQSSAEAKQSCRALRFDSPPFKHSTPSQIRDPAQRRVKGRVLYLWSRGALSLARPRPKSQCQP